METYGETSAPDCLADRVECIWTAQESGTRITKRVTPDGCADLIYARGSDRAQLFFVGSMSRFEDFVQAPCSVGVRFRPGMWNDLLRVSAAEVADKLVPLEEIWGKRGRELARRLDCAESPSEIARFLTSALPGTEVGRSPLQRAIGALENSRGIFSLDRAAREAGLSTRQFRRRCLESIGLSPKLLARILRFRHATELVVPMSGQHAGLAYECGYADQSHLIADFREFAGETPRQVAERFGVSESTTESAAGPPWSASARGRQLRDGSASESVREGQ